MKIVLRNLGKFQKIGFKIFKLLYYKKNLAHKIKRKSGCIGYLNSTNRNEILKQVPKINYRKDITNY